MQDRVEGQAPPPADSSLSVKQLDDSMWRAWSEKSSFADAKANSRRLKSVEWFCIAVLLAITVLWPHAIHFQLFLRVTLMFGAVIVGMQAARQHRFVLAAVFGGVALLYNPLAPVFELSGTWHWLIVLSSAIPFVTAAMVLNSRSRVTRRLLYPNRGWGHSRAGRASG